MLSGGLISNLPFFFLFWIFWYCLFDWTLAMIFICSLILSFAAASVYCPACIALCVNCVILLYSLFYSFIHFSSSCLVRLHSVTGMFDDFVTIRFVLFLNRFVSVLHLYCCTFPCPFLSSFCSSTAWSLPSADTTSCSWWNFWSKNYVIMLC